MRLFTPRPTTFKKWIQPQATVIIELQFECEYVKAIWSKCLQRTNELRSAVNPTENDLEKVLCCLEPNKTVLTVHSEVIMRIRALKENVDHLLLPKIFVKNAITSVSKKERNQEIKNQLLHLIDN